MKKTILLFFGTIFMASVFVIPQKAHAQEPFIGEIRMFAGNFAPRGWAFCDGQLLSISQNQALFAILGTIYGGDGRTNFALPDLRGRVAIHAGSGSGLSTRRQGAKGGEEYATLNVTNLPAHSHKAMGSSNAPDSVSPEGNVPAAKIRTNLYSSETSDVEMGKSAIAPTGGNQPHNNMQPYLGVRFIIALQGIFPSRN